MGDLRNERGRARLKGGAETAAFTRSHRRPESTSLRDQNGINGDDSRSHGKVPRSSSKDRRERSRDRGQSGGRHHNERRRGDDGFDGGGSGRSGGRGDRSASRRSPETLIYPQGHDEAELEGRIRSPESWTTQASSSLSRSGGSGHINRDFCDISRSRRSPMRFPHAEDEEGDAQAASDAPNQMLILQDLRRDAGSGDVGGSFRTITEAGGAGIVGGKEPAVKGCGCMTTATCLKLITLGTSLLEVGILWALHYDAASGRLCSFSKKNACVTADVSKALLTVARFTAGALFPSITFCIMSKCYATRHFLHHSWLSLIIDVEPTHKVHTYFGLLTLICSVIHSVAHIARLVYESQAEIIYGNTVNRSGLAALVLMIPTVVPMSVGYLTDTLTYEFRKLLHMIFLPCVAAICFHSKALRIWGIILVVWYLLDRLYFTTRMYVTEEALTRALMFVSHTREDRVEWCALSTVYGKTFYIDKPLFKAVGKGTLVRFDLPTGYQFKPGAYIQVNCPAISASEWHPFSIFSVPGPRPRAGFHAEAVGDWTEEMFRLCLEDPRMPLWITAAQPSVLEKTLYFDNVILVCTGAGITPALSVAQRFSRTKNIHLMWLSREASMIAMFEKQLRRVKSTVHLTGKYSAKTRKRMIDLLAPSRREVVTTTSCLEQHNSRPTSRSSSLSNVTHMLEEGDAPAAGPASFRVGEYRGVYKEDGLIEDGVDDDEEDDSILGAPAWRGSVLGGSALGGSVLGGGSTSGRGVGEYDKVDTRLDDVHRDRPSSRTRGNQQQRPHQSKGKRSRGKHPVSLNFGRPNIETFIAKTIQGTAVVAKWADVTVQASSTKDEPVPARLRQALGRLNTNQRISKRDLMSADLSVVKPKAVKARSVSSISGFDQAGSTKECGAHPESTKTWLVLYCGANAKVEKAVASACDGLNVTWRKEYFSAW